MSWMPAAVTLATGRLAWTGQRYSRSPFILQHQAKANPAHSSETLRTLDACDVWSLPFTSSWLPTMGPLQCV